MTRERRRSWPRGPRRRRASGRCVRAATPFPARAAGSSDRSPGRSRSGRTCPSAARGAPASANSGFIDRRVRRPDSGCPLGSNRVFTARISERLPGSSPQTSMRFSSAGEAFTTTAEPPRRPAQRAAARRASPGAVRRAADAQVEDAEGRPSGRERRAGPDRAGRRLPSAGRSPSRSDPARPLPPQTCRSYSVHNDRSSSPATTTASRAAGPGTTLPPRRPACRRHARSTRSGPGRDAAAIRSRWRKAQSATPPPPAPARRRRAALRTVATTVRETGASGASLNVALAMTASEPRDPQSSRARS